MPRTLPASSGARKWPGHQRPKPPSSTAQALSRRAVGRMRERADGEDLGGEPQQRRADREADDAGQQPVAIQEIHEALARSCARWRVIPPREHRLVHFGTARGTLSTFGRDFGSGAGGRLSACRAGAGLRPCAVENARFGGAWRRPAACRPELSCGATRLPVITTVGRVITGIDAARAACLPPAVAAPRRRRRSRRWRRRRRGRRKR